jgi:hypothetical protein
LQTLLRWLYFAWACVVYVIPSCTVSFFRYRLWETRDDLVDDLRHGKFQNQEQPRRLVAMLEVAIETAPEMSMLNFLLLHYSTRGAKLPRPFPPVELNDLTPLDRERLEKHLTAFHDAMTTRLLLGRLVAGWFR